MNVEIRDERFRGVVGDDVAFETVVSGCQFTEGPLWNPTSGRLLFSDIPASEIRCWGDRDPVRIFRKPSNMANGLAWDRSGHLLMCEHATSRVTVFEKSLSASVSERRDGTDLRVRALATHYQGKQLNSPNDIVLGPNGEILFTDPPYGRVEYYGVPREQDLDFQGVFRVGTDPEHPILLADDFDRPNGLCWSLDYHRLFVNDTARQHIRVFDVRENGSLSGGQIWAETVGSGPGAPDGMKVDSKGNVYCCGPGGIHVFASDATCLGVVQVPEYTANMAWGDEDLRSLYITASSSVYRIRTMVPGRPSG